MIVSRQNRKIKTIRRLRRCKGDHAILEGPHLVEDALQVGLDLDEILATPEFMAQAIGRKIERLLPREPLLVSAPLLEELTDADSPRGLLAVARLPRGGSESVLLKSDAVMVLAEGIQDPGNLGALARAVEGAGGTALGLTSGSVHPNHPRALRASAGSLLRLPVAVDVVLDDLLQRLSPSLPEVVALAAHGGEDLYDLETGGSVILVIGAEGPGVSNEMLAAADRRVTIPLHGQVESLNTAVAAAVALFEILRGRTSA
jgi:TrmH family RNA methyltransferase